MIGNRNRIPFLGTCLLVSLLLAPPSNNAALTIDMAAPKVTGQKAVIEVQTPLQNINANAAILRSLNVAPLDIIDQLEQLAIAHAKSLGY